MNWEEAKPLKRWGHIELSDLQVIHSARKFPGNESEARMEKFITLSQCTMCPKVQRLNGQFPSLVFHFPCPLFCFDLTWQFRRISIIARNVVLLTLALPFSFLSSFTVLRTLYFFPSTDGEEEETNYVNMS